MGAGAARRERHGGPPGRALKLSVSPERAARRVTWTAVITALTDTAHTLGGATPVWAWIGLVASWAAAGTAIATRRRVEPSRRALTDGIIALAATIGGIGAMLDYASGAHRLVDRVTLAGVCAAVVVGWISVWRAHGGGGGR